ncbi:MAG: carbohydrate ABC transporter permease [Armatimonadota bacterium]
MALTDPDYAAFLQDKYSELAGLNAAWGTHYKSFYQAHLASGRPAGKPGEDWAAYVSNYLPLRYTVNGRPANAENLFRAWVLKKYGSLAEVNAAWGTHFPDALAIAPPTRQADMAFVSAHRWEVRRHFLGRNYALVAGYILLHGRAVMNTAIFCLAVILTHLIVNPLCAYALSRYELKYGYKVLLFLLATMAFPAEVAMIPNFLLIKQLGMLNTYWALVLPGVASGYSIFLLKGFFDSLPKELYETGVIDGASELRMFRQITVPLSKPIFAVIALQSFMAAYGAFMFAFLVCQNPKMWTMMVWLYELQIAAPKYVTMAALSVAAIPTLLVFIFAQNVIMRGIILPSFK